MRSCGGFVAGALSVLAACSGRTLESLPRPVVASVSYGRCSVVRALDGRDQVWATEPCYDQVTDEVEYVGAASAESARNLREQMRAALGPFLVEKSGDLYPWHYSIDDADPVVGGSASDLAYVKPVWTPNGFDGDAGVLQAVPCNFALLLGEADGHAAGARDCAHGPIDEQTLSDLAAALVTLAGR